MNSYYFIVVVIVWTMDHFFMLEMCSIWKEVDGTYWFRGRWYIIPEETAAGRQSHNLRRELYRTNDFADIEVIFLFCL